MRKKNMPWHRILIAVAIAAILCLSVNLIILIIKTQSLANGLSSQNMSLAKHFSSGSFDFADSCYPFKWQKREQERLRYVLQRPDSASVGNDDFSKALYLLYAEKHPSEKVFQEGIRREPENALYHYLLADMYIKQGLGGDWPKKDKNDKKDVNFKYEYSIKNRKKLDAGMGELAIGLKLPFISHRDILIQTQLDAMPPAVGYEDRLKEIYLLADILLPEYAKTRYFARVNGFYLQTLLSEGKRKEAEPFLYTGERLVVQVSNDTPLTLIALLVAQAIGTISEEHDARVCRSFGLNSEAATIEKNIPVLLGKMRDWRVSVRKNSSDVYEEYAGYFPLTLFPVFGTQPEGLITKKTLTPSRLIEYVVIEKIVATALSFIAFVLFAFSGLKYWRLRMITSYVDLPLQDLELTRIEWRRIISYGLLIPVAFYLLFISIPLISGRDHGIMRSVWQFGISLVMLILWTLFASTIMAANIIKKRCFDFGKMVPDKVSQIVSVILTITWCCLALVFLLIPVSWTLLSFTLEKSPIMINVLQMIEVGIWGVFVLGMPLYPVIWTKKDDNFISYHLVMSKTMLTIYLFTTLLFASFVPVCSFFEKKYVKSDQIMKPFRQGNDISMTMIEGKVSMMLRDGIREGAVKLGIPWE
jgi:hypothetical protein